MGSSLPCIMAAAAALYAGNIWKESWKEPVFCRIYSLCTAAAAAVLLAVNIPGMQPLVDIAILA